MSKDTMSYGRVRGLIRSFIDDGMGNDILKRVWI